MTDVTNQSGGIDFKAEEVRVGADVVGRDKIVQNYTQPAAPAERCHNSLPNQPYFFGRKDELQRIAEALDPEAQGWGVLISGPGGIGKTALAIRAGHLAPEAHFPIKIFLSVKVTQLTPQGPEKLEDFMLPNYIALLSELACELGDDAIAKMDPNLRANEVRRLLADKHALLIIDNLETFDEKTERPRVFQFLSRLPRLCKALVTSRRRIDTPAEIIRLDKLERDDALKLIVCIAERNRYVAKTTEAERVELYEITRGNPLLIEWLAGQLGNPKSQCRTVADACHFMETAPKDNDPLEFVFGDLLDTFTEHETAVLAALTYFTQPARVKWIAEIAQITITQAETALEDLADRSVLVLEDRKYLLPPLTATFLRHARPEVIAMAGNSLSDRVYTLLSPLMDDNRNKDHGRFPALEAEWPKVAAAIPLLLQGDYIRLQATSEALTFFHEYRGHWDEMLALSMEAEKKAVAARDWDKAGWEAFRSGRVHRLRWQSAEVLACANRAAVYWQTAQAGSREQALAIKLRGTGYQLAKEYSAALAAYRQGLELYRACELESSDVANGLNSIARVEQLLGDYVAAERDYCEALRIAKLVNYHEGIPSYLGNLAGLALVQENWPVAEQFAREALPLAEQVG